MRGVQDVDYGALTWLSHSETHTFPRRFLTSGGKVGSGAKPATH